MLQCWEVEVDAVGIIVGTATGIAATLVVVAGSYLDDILIKQLRECCPLADYLIALGY